MTDNLIIVGDEAWTPEEWEAEQHRRERAHHRAYDYNRSPKRKEWFRAYQALPARRAYKRRWTQIQRAEKQRTSPQDKLVRVVASLHSLGCSGPTIRTGCRCSKTLIVQPVEASE